MTEKEYAVERAKLDVRDAESRLREARSNLAEGYKKGASIIEQAKADQEREYGKLKEELERAVVALDKERAYLQHMEAELARGFSSRDS